MLSTEEATTVCKYPFVFRNESKQNNADNAFKVIYISDRVVPVS